MPFAMGKPAIVSTACHEESAGTPSSDNMAIVAHLLCQQLSQTQNASIISARRCLYTSHEVLVKPYGNQSWLLM